MTSSRILSVVVLVLALGAVPASVWSQSFRVDDDFIDLLIEETNTLDDAIRNVNQVCRQEQIEVRKEFSQEKRQINRSLDSLERAAIFKRRDTNRNLSRLNKELDRIDNECDRARRVVRKRYGAAKAVPVTGAAGKTTAAAKRPPTVHSTPVSPKPKPKVKTSPPAWTKDLTVHGSIKNEVAYRLDSPHVFTKNRYQVLLQESLQLNQDYRLRSSQRAFFDTAVKNFNDHRPPGFEKNDLESEVTLRELYLDGTYKEIDFRLGKQQIVWGEAVGMFVADVVNGRDLREYLLPDFDWIRRPQWSIDVIRTGDSTTFEGLITMPEFDKLGTRGSEFEPPFPSPIVPFALHGEDEPSGSLSNADIGGRIGHLVGGLDIGFFFLHTWNKTPVIERKVLGSLLHLTPVHKRMDIAGATFSRDVGDSILKGEMTFKPNQPYTTTDPFETDGIDSSMTLDAVLGLDHSFGEVDTNVQILQKFVSKAGPLLNEDSSRTHFTFWAKTERMQGRVMPEILIAVSPTRRDHLYRPKIVFKASDHVLFKIGADIFDGNRPEGLFAIFDGKSRVFYEVDYHF